MAEHPGEAFTQLVLTVFRLNGALIAAGDALVGDLGLTSARWQVLGMVVDQPLTVPAIARRVGVARQSVQRIAHLVVQDGLAVFLPNPDHATAHLLALSERGRKVMAEVDRRQAAWAKAIAQGATAKDLEGAERLLHGLCDRVHADREGRKP